MLQSETITSPVLEPAVPTLRLDPAMRAAVLAVPRPALLPTLSTPIITPLLIGELTNIFKASELAG